MSRFAHFILTGIWTAIFTLNTLAQAETINATSTTDIVVQKAQTYVLTPDDTVEIKVYQEDDLTTKASIAQDGTISFPLIGLVQIGGKTVQEAGALVRDLLNRDYLVNPQVTLIVVDYAKRRFTVLGQVQKPGSFEIPSQENVTLLEAIAMAGGYTRLSDTGRIQVVRVIGNTTSTITIDAKHRSTNAAVAYFRLLPDDTVTVPERFF